MPLRTRLEALATRLGQEFKAIREEKRLERYATDPAMLYIDPDKWSGPPGQRMTVPGHVTPAGGQTTHPSLLYFPDGWNGYRYWMGHTPYPGSNDDHEDPNIVVSNDGVTWSFFPGMTNPLDDQDGQSEYNSDIDLVMGPDNTMYAFWRFYDPNLGSLQEKMFYRSSKDGLNWGPKTTVWQYNQTALRPLSPSFIWDGTRWTVYAVDVSNSAAPRLIRMTSTGATPTAWNSPVTSPITGLQSGFSPWHIEVRKCYGQWVALLHVTPTGVGGADGYLVLMVADDGLNWTASSKSVIPQVVAGEHDQLYRATFVPEMINGIMGLRVYYSAYTDGTAVWNIYRTWIAHDSITHIERGSGTGVTVNMNTDLLVNVTFFREFADVPDINVTTNSGRCSTAVVTVTTTGFSFRIGNWSTANAVAISYSWSAQVAKF